jgi:NAD(P)-dependent dehydrogenase (short-subunit alcohol dehydrogenase family)
VAGFGSRKPPGEVTAADMLAVYYPQIRINAVDPGYTATDLNDHHGTQTVQPGAEIIAAMAGIGAGGPTCGYFDAAGPVPW